MPSHYFPGGKPLAISQGGAPNEPGGFFNSVNNLIENPFLMNLLAQSGFSTMPQSPFGAIGRAALGAQFQKQGRADQDVRNRFMEAQIKALLAPKEQEIFTPLTDQEEAAIFGKSDPERAFQRGSISGKVTQIGGGGVTVNTGTTQKLSDELAKGLARDFTERAPDARQAVSSLQSITNAKQQVEQGIVSGQFADARLAVAKALNLAGLTDDERIANTETFMAQTGGLVAQLIKQFGAGTGLSDADREFAQKMAGGDITLNDKSITRILNMAETAQKNLIKQFNSDRKRLIDFDPSLEILLGPEISIPNVVEFSDLPE
jgi:hypothetical protein